MMRISLLSATLILGCILVAAPLARAEEMWLDTGTVTRIDGATFHLLNTDNSVFEIEASQARVFIGQSEEPSSCCAFSVGDTVRVYGLPGGPGVVSAQRVRVLNGTALAAASPPDSEIRIVVRKPMPAGAGAGPEDAVPAEWTGTGLVTDVSYGRREITIRNSQGGFLVTVPGHVISDGRRVGLGLLDRGDTVRIAGTISGLNTVRAMSVELLRSISETHAQVPQYPAAATGKVTHVDYASFTFTLQTNTLPVQVLVDPGTDIYQHVERMAFMDLKPGMEVKMTGNGNPATGFAARRIQIVGTVP